MKGRYIKDYLIKDRYTKHRQIGRKVNKKGNLLIQESGKKEIISE